MQVTWLGWHEGGLIYARSKQLCCLAAFLVLEHFAQAQFQAYDLGTLGGPSSAALGINVGGTIVGWSTTSGGSNHAFSDANGMMTDLDTLGGALSHAAGINSSGTIVGSVYLINWRAFVCTDGTMSELGTLGGSYSYARAINNAGVIVGNSVNTSGQYHAFRYSGALMTDLGTLGGSYSEALGINDAGTIVGYSTLSVPVEHAFSYSGGVMTDLGSLIGPSGDSRAQAINAGGIIVGWSNIDPSRIHAFRDSNGVMQDLGSALGGNSVAYGINTAGTIVGEMSTSDYCVWHAFAYADGATTDLAPFLSSIGITGNSSATAIGDNGEIVGYGTLMDGSTRAFRIVTVPEPELLGVIPVAATVLFASRQRRQSN